MKLKVSIFLFFLFVFISCSKNENSEKINRERKVKWERVKSYSGKGNIYTFTGKVESAKDVNLSFRVSGVIDHIVGKNGTFVKKGDVIASLDKRDYIEQYNATKAEYDAISGEVNRIIALYESESVSENDYNKAVNGLKQITAKLNAHQNALNDVDLIAPFDGYIQKLHFECGETVKAGLSIVSFVSTEEMEVVVNIPYDNYVEFDKYESAVATTPKLPNTEFDLDIIGISPKSNLSQLHAARFAIKTSDNDKIVSGMSLFVTIVYQADKDSSLCLPLTTIFEKDDKSHVWVISNDNTVELREVIISEVKSNGNTIITSGVSVGERVVSAGVNSITEGMKVIPLSEKSQNNIGVVL